MTNYCDNCNQYVNTSVINKTETYKVLGEEIELEAQVLVCEECGEEIYSENLDSNTLNKAYDIYRKRHELLHPEEIKKIRQQYGLSQRSFAKLLNWSDKTIRSYENGSIPDSVHNGLLKLLKDPEVMSTYIKQNKTSLEDDKLDKLKVQLSKLTEGNTSFDEKIVDYYFATSPSIENGFKLFDYNKVRNVVFYYASKMKNLPKTKLLKLLHYSDMIHYKKYGTSITGMTYLHFPYGPVPNRYEILLESLQQDETIVINIIDEGDFVKYIITPSQNYVMNELTEDEENVLNTVTDKFMEYTARDISEYSHKEKGYKMTSDRQVISYEYALDLDLD